MSDLNRADRALLPAKNLQPHYSYTNEIVMSLRRQTCAFPVAAAALVASLASGCGGSEKLVQVTGTVTRGGKPVPNLMVHFMPEKGPRSIGVTDENGQFKMRQTSGEEGVFAGTQKVWVELPAASVKDAKGDPTKGPKPTKNDPEIAAILKKYGKAETTPIVVEANEDKVVKLTLD